MGLLDLILGGLDKIPGILPKSGFRISPAGERGIFYFDRSGTYNVSAYYVKEGKQREYHFRRADIFKINASLPVERQLSAPENSKAQEIEQNVREWLDKNGITNSSDEGLEERVRNFKIPPRG